MNILYILTLVCSIKCGIKVPPILLASTLALYPALLIFFVQTVIDVQLTQACITAD